VENPRVRRYNGDVRFGQLVMFGGLGVAASAASFGACLSGGAPRQDRPSAPAVDDGTRAEGTSHAGRATPDTTAAPPSVASVDRTSQAAIPTDPLLDGGAGGGSAMAAPHASCRAPKVAVEGPPVDGVVFNNAMTSADAGYVDRTAQVLAALSKESPRIGCCLEPSTGGDVPATGALLIVIELAPSGSVVRAFVDEPRSSVLAAGIPECIAAIVREIRFPRSPADRTTLVEYPLKWSRPES